VDTAPAFPKLRWVALAWIAVWFPAYAVVWGWQNFLLVCDIAVILTFAGLWRGNALLLSSQAVGSLVPDALWFLDVAWRFALGRHLFGGTEYLWDARFPLWVRLLSFFHVALPVVVVYAVSRVGYDPRGWKLQGGITAVLLVVSRFLESGKNPNYAFTDPVFHLQLGPVPLHLAVILAGFVVLIYLPTHAVLRKLLPGRKR
jgi:hypothetical protein